VKLASAQATPPSPPPAAKAPAGGYPASAKSKVFHLPGCEFAGKIKASNLVTYKTREEAMAAGREPAGCCNP
jgi:micrococcal nuclease